MTDRPADPRPMTTLTDLELEAALLDLGGALAPAAASDLARSVRLRVEVIGAPSARRARWFHRWSRPTGTPFRRGLALALIALLVLAGIVAAIGFGLPGLRVVILGPGQTFGPVAASGAVASPGRSGGTAGPTSSPTTWPIASLGLGDPVDPAALDATAGYHVLRPTLPELGTPVGAFVRGATPRAQVAVAYPASAAFPAGPGAPQAGDSPVALIVMQYPGTTDGGLLKKILSSGSTIQGVTVAGQPGFWISGAPHELMYVDPDGQVESDTVRLAGNVLAWNDGRLTVRIEGAPDLNTALRIAESMR